MNHAIISLFLTANLAIIFSYCFAKLFLGTNTIKTNLTQIQQLKLARFIFIVSILAFCLMPYFINFIPTDTYDFERNHTLEKASTFLIHSKKIVMKHIAHSPRASHLFSFQSILFLFFSAGLIFVLGQYVKNILKLRQLLKASYLYRKHNKIHILISNTLVTPFCWSFFHKHFILINQKNSGESRDWNMILRHELAHIRHHDTNWLHVFAILKWIFFINPFHYFWVKWFQELQEYACDEAIVMKNKTKNTAYAQCLINSARCDKTLWSWNGASSMSHLHHKLLYRRVNMIFSYQKKSYRLFFIFACLQWMVITSVAFAVNKLSDMELVSANHLKTYIAKSNIDSAMKITAEPEVVLEIKRIQKNHHARKKIKESLARMTQYQPVIEPELEKNNVPKDFLAMPLIQSGYRELDESQNKMRAAGIWQIVPTTAENLGLIINKNEDQRLNTRQSTDAAIRYLTNLYNQFHDWKMVVLAYEYGENHIEKLIKESGAHNAWSLARSKDAPKEMRRYLAQFDAAVIIMHNPALITGHI